MAKVQCNHPLETVVVQDMFDIGRSNIWLRKNIVEITNEETEDIQYQADELFMEVTYKEGLKGEIEANFDHWWTFIENSENVKKELTLEEKFKLLEQENETNEQAIMELSMMIVMGGM